MKTVYKYALKLSAIQTVTMPGAMSAKLLSVQVQRDIICLWAFIDTDLPNEDIQIIIAGTGHPVEYDSVHHIDTFQVKGGEGVFHVFKAFLPKKQGKKLV